MLDPIFRPIIHNPLDAAGRWLAGIGLSPNQVTIAGLGLGSRCRDCYRFRRFRNRAVPISSEPNSRWSRWCRGARDDANRPGGVPRASRNSLVVLRRTWKELYSRFVALRQIKPQVLAIDIGSSEDGGH